MSAMPGNASTAERRRIGGAFIATTLLLTACDESELNSFLRDFTLPEYRAAAEAQRRVPQQDIFGTYEGVRYRIKRFIIFEENGGSTNEWFIETPQGLRQCDVPTTEGCVEALKKAAAEPRPGYVPRQEDDKM